VACGKVVSDVNKERERMNQEHYDKVDVLESEIEAQLLESILNERGIPHRIRSYHDTAYDGLFQTQKGWGLISGPAAATEAIKRIIAEVRKGAGT
jgi:hypothetical protein